jgi:hypothetical protein
MHFTEIRAELGDEIIAVKNAGRGVKWTPKKHGSPI